jgi:UDP-N-acetylglucosamine--N-acetylmuramyl-(pentapeptide) pyrophosphoryl-undecaprenol N-acetylglucosamine transferase
MKKIVFTGGGSAGHVTPNIALFSKLRADGVSMIYIGSERGIERQIIEQYKDIDYYPISTGKLRRYWDVNNLKDPFRVIKGVLQSYRLLKRIRPDVVFSKGGFVSVPVIIGSRLNGIPVIIHESDLTPGLANKLSIPLATKVCATFPETLSHLPATKAEYTGAPIRDELLQGDAKTGRMICGFHSQKPILLVIGGSLGSRAINQAVREGLADLLMDYQIIHICGKGNEDESLRHTKGYCQFEYIGDELAHVLAATDLAVSRAGSNVIFELLAARIPMLLIPLSKQVSRGDQLLNAASFEKMGYSKVLHEENLTSQSLHEGVRVLRDGREAIEREMAKVQASDALERIIEILRSASSV